MQQLRERRLTNTPADIPQVRSNCGLSLNSLEGKDSVADLKTSLNNPDAALTLKGENMQVYVLNHMGKPIMPCSPRRARLLLKQGRVKLVTRTPFTIQWIVPTRSFVQPVTLGVDSGYVNIGLSAVTEKKEVYSSNLELRTDIVKLNSERRQYRRARRYRKTWYRKPRFLNRKKPEGWLAPSIQHKLDSHIKVINQVKAILPISHINIGVAAFDIQKIKNPNISGADYQNGVQKDFWNVRSKDKILEIHHILSKQTGGNRPDNLITLCRNCHKKVSAGELILKVQPSRGFKAETFMSMVRWMLVNKLRGLGNSVSHTYGYITKSKRIQLGLPKSYINDAFVIAGGDKQKKLSVRYHIRQVRKCNRKLFKGDRSHIRNTAQREVFGFRQWDKVLYAGRELFIKGRRIRGSFALSDITGRLVKEVSYKKTALLERAKTMLIERRDRIALHPNLMVQNGVFCGY